ncbi:MAG: flagellar basal body rod protein FlgB [Oscillospiraceae bacterium]|jgi:flagellar basal-body rod protein FlgB|nr:flagellar basal body rod protein FlgB [Oscillospiraceae bacterium]
MWSKLFKPVDTLQKGLEASWMRNSVIRNNIANAETPNFKASDVQFESLIADAMQRDETNTGFVAKTTHERHIQFDVVEEIDLESIEPLVAVNDKTSIRMDGNNVDIESENVKLAQNSLLYNTLLTKLNSELTRIKMAVNEGR